MRVVQSGVMSKTTRVALLVVLAVVALALTGVGIGLWTAADSPAPKTVAATQNPNAVECVNIDRAYNAWAMARLRGAHEFETVNEVTIRDEMDDQEALMDAVEGYDDQPSKTLAVAVAGLGVALGMLNVEMTIGDGVTAEQAAKAAAAHRDVREKYGAWRSATCG